MVSEQKGEEFMPHCPCWPFIMDLLSLKVRTGVLKTSDKAMQPTFTALSPRAVKFPPRLSSTKLPARMFMQNFDMNT